MLILHIRSLLRTIYTVEKIPISCKCTNNEKTNIIKNLNVENKCIYGSLLETQKQRRKRFSKVIDGVPGSSKKLTSKKESEVPTNTENETKSKQGSRKRKKECKSSEVHTDLSGVISPLPSAGQVVGADLGDANPNLESGPSQISSKKKSKKLNSCKSSVPPTKNYDTSSIVKCSNEFVFKSSIPIDEVNYPFQNPDKVEILDTNSSLEIVLNYGFSDPLTKNSAKFTSVSKVLEETMSEKSKLVLSKWRKNKIAELGEEGFNKYNEGLKTRGSEFHLAVRRAVQGEAAGDYSNVTTKALKSLEWILPYFSKPLAVESIVAHPQLEYRGIPDCVALFKDTPVVIDWKLSEKPKRELRDTYEAPVQISAYIGALNHDPNYKWGISHGLVAVAYTSGNPCDVFLLSPQHCLIYWRHWLMRVDKFKARSHFHIDHDIDESSL